MPRISYGPERDARLAQWAKQQLANYIDTGGVKGHVEDMSFIGGHRFETMLLIRYAGRKSGRTMIISLGYCQFGPEIAIIASLGGSDVHPQWYLNIKAGAPLAFQVATQAFACTWREPVGDEREELWRWMVRANPIWGTYRKATTRELPLLLLKPLEEIPVFTRADLTVA
ncbi:MAG: nitroreductase family deazaflavin-dependent oxidoreductase [Caulobacteraceae bacterium]|nr:nitroreductase family deazaflavin-dependent oxidoreductase [Caulobacteraceae bacterium]